MTVSRGIGRTPLRPTPPEDSPRRCQANCREREGRPAHRCRRWAPEGERYCKKHRDRYQNRRHGRSDVSDPWKAVRELPHVYSRMLSDSLAQRVRELAQRPLADQADNSELLALCQSTAVDAAQLYDVTCQAADEMARQVPGKAMEALQTKLAAGALLREVAAEVVDLTAQAIAARAVPRELIGVDNAHNLMVQVVRAAHDVFGEDDPAKVEEFARRVSEARLLREGNAGTEVTPDMDAAAMDGTVPLVAGPVRDGAGEAEAA